MNGVLVLRTSPAARRIALAAALCGGAAFLAGLWAAPQRAWLDLLVSSFFLISLGLAGLVFIAIQRLANAGWWSAIRRVPEGLMDLIPWAAVSMLAVFLGRHYLYPWSRPGALADPRLAAKSAYLNEPFFLARMAFFLGVWSLFAALMRRSSLAEDREGGLAQHRRQAKLSAVFLVVFAVTFSFASFDWLMSLDPFWASTMFAVHTFAGLFLEGLAAITLCVVVLRRRGPLAGVVRESHLHDLGKLLFAFSTFWAYTWVCQYLLIWYGNLSEEIPYYLARTNGAWLPWFVIDPVLNWGVPFIVLLPRAAKRNTSVLFAVSAVVLVGRWLGLYLIAAPAVLPGPRIGALELVMTIGFGGLAFLAATRSLAA